MDHYKNEPKYHIIRESAHMYDSRPFSSYTIEDYYALPDEQRVELINGVFYDMASPTVRHQSISMKLGTQLENYVSRKRGKCRVLAGPVDVQLDCDDKTMVVPDIIIACDPEKVLKDRIMGAPDFVAEIVSPSSKRRDYVIKAGKYCEAGVREYWIIDPDMERVIVYDFESDAAPIIYSMVDEVPVRIFDGELMICFPEDESIV